MTFRAVALGADGQSSAVTSFTFTVPGSVADKDVLTVLSVCNNGTAIETISGGGTGVTWTLRSGRDNSSANNLNTEVWSATANGTSASSTITVTTDNSAHFIGVLLIESGQVETGIVFGLNTVNAAGTSMAFPSVTVPDATGWTLIGLGALRVGSGTTAATVTPPAGAVLEGSAFTNYSSTPVYTAFALHKTATVGSGSQTIGTATSSLSATGQLYTIALPPGVNYVASPNDSTVAADRASFVQGMQRSKTDAVQQADLAQTALGMVRGRPDSATSGDSATAVKGTARSATVYDSTTARDRGSSAGAFPLTGLSRSRTTVSGDSAVAQVHHTPVGLNLTTYHLHADGTLHRWLRDPTILLVPGAPTGLSISQSGTTADLAWSPPLSDGGSPVISYTASIVGGSTQTLGPGVFTAHFTGLTPGVQVTFKVACANVLGTGPAAFISSLTARFPGDTNSKITSSLGLGFDEGDKNPGKLTSPERAAPELLSGVKAAAVRYYFKNSTDLNVPNGAWPAAIVSQYNQGRICWGSWNPGNWADAADGRFNAILDGFIAWAEETAPNVPIPWTPSGHEPNFLAQTGRNASDFGHYNRYVRSRMDNYASTGGRGGVGVYKWKRLSFGPIHTAQDYTKTSPTGPQGPVEPAWEGAALITATATASTDVLTTSIPHLLSNGRRVTFQSPPAGLNATTTYFVVNATSTTFKVALTLNGAAVNITADATGVTVVSRDVYDWMGVDPYISRDGGLSAFWTPNFSVTMNWVETAPHIYPLGLAECAIYNRDPTAALKIGQFYDKLLDGTHDVWAWLYYNSIDQSHIVQLTGADDGTGLSTQFLLDNVSNGGLLNQVIALMQDSRSVNFWELTRPDGTFFTRPPGV